MWILASWWLTISAMDGTGRQRDAQPRFLERELSWLQFNQRVQAEADNPANPLLERAKFLAIVTSNLDEFMQVRFHRLLERAAALGNTRWLPSGLTDADLLLRVQKAVLRQQNLQYMLYEGIHSELFHRGVQLYPIFMLTDAMQARIREIFINELMPRLKPVPWGEEISPFTQKRLHLMVRLRPRHGGNPRYATIALPGSPRLYELPSQDDTRCFIRQEDLVRQFLPLLFPEDYAEEATVFRLLRNQDFLLSSEGDVATAVREMLLKRRTGDVMRMNIVNGVDVDAYPEHQPNSGDSTVRLLALASMSGWHGYDRILHSLAQYRGDTEVRIDFAGGDGDGSLATWTALAKELGLEERVTFHVRGSAGRLSGGFERSPAGSNEVPGDRETVLRGKKPRN